MSHLFNQHLNKKYLMNLKKSLEKYHILYYLYQKNLYRLKQTYQIKISELIFSNRTKKKRNILSHSCLKKITSAKFNYSIYDKELFTIVVVFQI